MKTAAKLMGTLIRHAALLLVMGCPALVAAPAAPARAEFLIVKYGAVADDETQDTAAIQQAIDACATAGGGTVRIPKGRFVSGGLTLKDNVRLLFEAGALLEGSPNPADYGGKSVPSDALIKGNNLKNVSIEGPGLVDGVDCVNPKGEEKFRGPHAIFLTACSNVVIEGITIKRAANYAMLLKNCTNARIERVVVQGGHDGVHAQACSKFVIRNCDLLTGDDSVAGCDNADFEVTGCKINSSCNGFRFGCQNFLVKDCKIWGPGEHQHRISNRKNMLSAFVHFAPKDRNPKQPSDNWLIQNVTIDNADAVYGYDFERGLWQTGQPVRRVQFRDVKATGIFKPLRVLGDAGKLFELTMENVSIAMREDRRDQELLNFSRFGSVVLTNVTLQNSGKKPVLQAKDGNSIRLERVTPVPANAAPFQLENITTVKQP